VAWLLHGAVSLLLLLAAMRMMEGMGGFSTGQLSQQGIEWLLLITLYTLLYALLRPRWWRGLLALLPLLLLYLVHDLFYLAFGKVFRLINIAELPELLQILPLGYALPLLALLLLPLALLLWQLNYQRPRRLLLGLLPLLLVVFTVKGAPLAFTQGFERWSAGIVTYSDARSVEQNGRLAMLAYREAQRGMANAQLGPYRDRPGYERQAGEVMALLRPHNSRRNIHLIVLESFLDPRLFTGLRFSSPPVHPEFERLFGAQLGLSRSPVFGGATAQAEFELLCGLPAFEAISSVEFNLFDGAAVYCLPGLLAGVGYRAVATNTYKPNFFNALPAYQGMGFSDSFFPQEYSGSRQSYLRLGEIGDEEYLFDKPLFEQNLTFVRQHLQQHPGQPLFNYVLTIYGHTPHLLDAVQRPEHITLDSPYPDDHLSRVVNQFYYRSEAIAAYLKQLMALDPQSLIVLVSDHVPPLRNGPNTYNALRYLDNREGHYYYNRLAILENGVPRRYPDLHHYELMPLMLNYQSSGAYCAERRCAFADERQREGRAAYMARYLQLLAHASQ
jgi:phosphoglycerol transferase MdoB-like AlkP superfamily enzyme